MRGGALTGMKGGLGGWVHRGLGDEGVTADANGGGPCRRCDCHSRRRFRLCKIEIMKRQVSGNIDSQSVLSHSMRHAGHHLWLFIIVLFSSSGSQVYLVTAHIVGV